MSRERFQLVEEAFQAAAGLEPGARRHFVTGQYGRDPELCREVLALLDHHEAGGIAPHDGFLKSVRATAEAAMRDAAPGTPPTRIASYRILRPLGEGGFGMVYLAEQDHPRRTVALKLLRTAFASGEIARRFEYEARILARLRHPGIAQIYEAGSAEINVAGADGRVLVMRQPFLALEYVEGPNLIDFALGDAGGRPALPVRDRLALLASVCDALQHAHQNGVIHRDLKPDNILVSCEKAGDRAEEGRRGSQVPPQQPHPKLLDFGVARVMDADPDLTRAQTMAGRMIGTLGYMSPEQVAGDNHSIDTRSDVYAMGVLMHQLLSGRPPYDVGAVPLDQAVRIVREREPPPIRSLDRSIRADANAVIQKAMAKDRERRYPSMAELAADVRRLLSGEPVAAKGNSHWYVLGKTMKRHRVALGVTAAFVLVLASSSVMGWMLYVSAQRAHAHSDTLLRESYLNQARAMRASNSIGRRFASTDLLRKAAALGMGEDLRSEAIAALCASDFRTLRTFPPGPASARGLASLDRIALIGKDRTIRVVDLDTGRDIRRIPAREVSPTRVRFNASGTFLGAHYPTTDQTTIAIWSLDDAEPVLLRTVPSGPTDFAFGATRGRAWAALPRADAGLEIVSLPSGERLAAFDTGGNAFFMTASPDGSRLALIGPRGGTLDILDASTGATLASWKTDAVLRSPCWSPDGAVIGACGDDRRVHLWSSTTREPLRPLEGHRAATTELAIGSEMVATSGWDGTLRLWDMHARAEAFTPLLGAELLGFDGSRLALSDEDGVRVLAHSDDSPRRVLHAAGPLGAEGTINFCPGSPTMGVAGAGGVQLWDTRSWRSVTLTRREARNVMFPKDGRTVVALLQGELHRWDLGAAWDAAPGSAPSEIIWSGWWNAWASLHPDGASIVVSDRAQILRVDLASGVATRMAAASPNIERPIVDPSARWLFLGTWRGAPAQIVDLHAGMTVLSLGQSSVRGTFSPDGALLTVGLPGRHLVFDTGRWDSPLELPGREPGLATVAGASAVAPDSPLMAYVEPPHVIRLADPRNAEILATLPNAERYGVPDLQFSPDGNLLVVLTLEETILVWQLDQLRYELTKRRMEW